ncbi:TRAM domain-containing protein [Brevibacterium sp. 50QC2O2]|uniref:class I SAM-dependent RNA methyltransferase n=1 Tax=Brevibacterium sp. 50QC2O2 TaxID=2968459 RepID=UPI00211D1159|nr:methyltransferase domain-containing protein [Brevibacterium sp. 50QC2O2]MCQ9388388.1 TRAM domain-containing protein [Brevibacterium sp. 50QC2O2]
MNERPQLGDELELQVLRPAAGGESVATGEYGTVFVTGTLPGETVRARITEIKPRFARAATVEVLDAAAARVPDRRVAWGAEGVGGVEFAHVDLATSRDLKAQAARDQLARIGGIETELSVAPAPLEATGGQDAGQAWRTRVQLAVRPDGRPGMYRAGTHDVVDVDRLPLAVGELDALGVQHGVFPGVSRIELAAGTGCGTIVATGRPSAQATAALRSIAEASGFSLLVASSHGRVAGAGRRQRGGKQVRARRPKPGSDTAQGAITLGETTLLQRVAASDFRVSAQGFWQVHRDAAEVLSDRVLSRIDGTDSVLDLYCGAGLFSLRAAHELGVPVIGLEGSARAVEDARANAQRLLGAGSTGAEFGTARIERLTELPGADTVIVDPPRAGLGQKVVDLISGTGAGRLLYVSCDPGTFARDAKNLLERGWRLETVEGHDLFPLTAHVEFFSEFVR